MPIVAGVVLSQVISLVIDEARLPVPRIHRGIMDADDVFEIVTDLTDGLDGAHFVRRMFNRESTLKRFVWEARRSCRLRLPLEFPSR
jgi:hypothetical protein